MTKMLKTRLLGLTLAAGAIVYAGCQSENEVSSPTIDKQISKFRKGAIEILLTANVNLDRDFLGCDPCPTCPSEDPLVPVEPRFVQIIESFDSTDFAGNSAAFANYERLYTLQAIYARRYADPQDGTVESEAATFMTNYWSFVMNNSTIGLGQIQDAQTYIRAQIPYSSVRDSARLENFALSLPNYVGITIDSAINKFTLGN